MSDIDAPSSADSVSRGVNLFLARMLADPTLNWTFEGVDQPVLQRHALAFVIAALGGPDRYLGRDMRTVHQRFKLTDKHFDTAVEHLVEALREAGISEGVLGELAVRLEPLRRSIVSA
jgi:hemoglobin